MEWGTETAFDLFWLGNKYNTMLSANILIHVWKTGDLTNLIMLDLCLRIRPMTGLGMTTLQMPSPAEHDNDVHMHTPSFSTISGPFLTIARNPFIHRIGRSFRRPRLLNPPTYKKPHISHACCYSNSEILQVLQSISIFLGTQGTPQGANFLPQTLRLLGALLNQGKFPQIIL